MTEKYRNKFYQSAQISCTEKENKKGKATALQANTKNKRNCKALSVNTQTLKNPKQKSNETTKIPVMLYFKIIDFKLIWKRANTFHSLQ